MANDPRSPFHPAHPLAGKIKTGVRTTADRAETSIASLPLPTIRTLTAQDRAHQMFGMQDKKGTRVYYVEGELPFNTVDAIGNAITFIGGLYKTNNRATCDYLQEHVDAGRIKYLELEADPSVEENNQSEHIERPEGSSSDASQSDEPNEQESSNREESASEPNREGPGGEGPYDPELPQPGSTLSSSSGAGDDGESQNVDQGTTSLKDKLGLKG
jgi:hypothetical protein